jgi:serine/threonine protein kinase
LGGGARLAPETVAGVSTSWERATTLFGAARELDADARAAFLDAACGADGALRSAVEELLAQDRPDDSFLATPSTSAIRDLLEHALEAELASGEVLQNRYRIEERLGTGGQAVVYRATDLTVGRTVVVKVMRAEARANRLLKKRFELEMQALSRIDHPGVVGILDVGELEDHSPFLIIQHVSGVSLRTLLTGSALPPTRVAAILRELGAALGAAHAAGVAHQDLKPENILVQRRADGGDTVKLIDFGIAKIDQSELDAGVTTVMIAGTVKYMAPEQFEGRNVPAGDIYALGLIAHEMLTGTLDLRAPVEGMKTVTRHIDRATQPDPAQRPDDVNTWCAEIASALERPRSYRRGIALTVAAMLLVVGSVVGSRLLAAPPRVIEKVGAFDPVAEGFLTHGDVTGTVAMNVAKDGYDGWRVFSHDQGIYHRRLSRAQKKTALARGWTLTAKLRPQEGMTFAHADFFGYGRRFEVCVYRQPDRTMVARLTTQVLPSFQGPEAQIRDDGQYHEYELRFDSGQQMADLWIDGVKRLTGYRGVSDFQDPQDDWGVAFGASNYKSERSEGSFRLIRFEINP